MVAKSRFVSVILVCLIVSLNSSCEKMDESGFLDVSYHQVTDVKQYCQGICEDSFDWENHEIGIMGYIPDIENDATLEEYKSGSHIFLSDIRNGIIVDIKIQEGLNEIFDTLYTLQKTDKLYIQGIARSVMASDGQNCEKGVFIDLYGIENVKINSQ